MKKPHLRWAGGTVVPRSLAVLATASAVLATATAGVAQAKLTGPGGALKGCVDKHGVLHVVAFGAHCPHGEQAIVFGAQGGTGQAGTGGPGGPAGPTGPAGAAASEGTVTTLKAEVSALQSQNATLTSKVGTLETKAGSLETKAGALETTLAGVTRTGNTLAFSGMNIQLDSGSGATADTVNGLGNLFIGYDEHSGEQSGSNNLVVGEGQSFTSYGALLAGANNTVQSPFGSAVGGEFNVVSGPGASVLGGCDNLAGEGAVPTGPCQNKRYETFRGVVSNHAGGA
jgi:hypothetical protein